MLRETLAYLGFDFLFNIMAVEPKPAAYKVAGGGFRRAPGGADDFLNADAGDKNDYDWWVLQFGVLLALATKFPLISYQVSAFWVVGNIAIGATMILANSHCSTVNFNSVLFYCRLGLQGVW